MTLCFNLFLVLQGKVQENILAFNENVMGMEPAFFFNTKKMYFHILNGPSKKDPKNPYRYQLEFMIQVYSSE